MVQGGKHERINHRKISEAKGKGFALRSHLEITKGLVAEKGTPPTRLIAEWEKPVVEQMLV